jgi:hypothetical protein
MLFLLLVLAAAPALATITTTGDVTVDFIDFLEVPEVNGGQYIEFPVLYIQAFGDSSYSVNADVIIGQFTVQHPQAHSFLFPAIAEVDQFIDGGFGTRGERAQLERSIHYDGSTVYVAINISVEGFSTPDEICLTQLFGIRMDGPSRLTVLDEAGSIIPQELWGQDDTVHTPEPGTYMVGLGVMLILGIKGCRPGAR